MEDKNYPPPFQWVEFPEGRARFSGSIRGWDEQGHETFELRLRNQSYFGEIKDVWVGEKYRLVIKSFGYKSIQNVGIPLSSDMKTVGVFTTEEVGVIKKLITNLIDFTSAQESRPFVMSADNISDFNGEVLFSDGWCLIDADRRVANGI